MVQALKETSLPTSLSKYDLKDIYNVEVFGVFYKFMTSKAEKLETSNKKHRKLKSEKSSGGTLSKVPKLAWLQRMLLGIRYQCL